MSVVICMLLCSFLVRQLYSLLMQQTLETKAGEKRILWAIQEGMDKTSRVVLPKWMSIVIELRVCKHVSEYDKWQTILQKRESMGKGLTPSQDANYNAFMADCQQKLVFNTRKQCFVSDITTLRRQLKDCITFTLELSPEADDLMFTAANGQSYRLVLLKMSADGSDQNECPSLLNQPSTCDDICEDGQHKPGPCGEDADADGDAMDEAQIRQMEHDKSIADAGGGVFDKDDVDQYELLCDSDDGLQNVDLPPGVAGITRVKAFDARPAWLALEARSLVDIPRHVKGCFIAYHSTTQQWQGHYPQSNEILSSSWGKTTKRTETESILRVVRGILQTHVNACPKDGAWKRQLDKVHEAEATL